MSVLALDFETRSPLELKKVGAYVYAQHRHTDIWLGAWAFDDDEPQLWHPGEPVPAAIIAHVLEGGEVRAWNAAFERIIWRAIAHVRYGWPLAENAQFVCTMAEAAAMALPLSLDKAAAVVGSAQQKDDAGYRLMLKMAKPKPVKKGDIFATEEPEWHDDPELVFRLGEYCKQDVRTERGIVKALRRLSPQERQVYLLNQQINDRGLRLDIPLIHAAQKIVARGMAEANTLASAATNGQVTKLTNHAQVAEWIRSQGQPIEGVSKPVVQDVLDTDFLLGETMLAPAVRDVLKLRADAGRTSVAKLTAMLTCRGADDRVRGLLQYHAASTGRDGGRLVQPQNFPRGEVKGIMSLIDAVMAGEYETIDLTAPPVVVIVSMLRNMFIPAEGKDFLAGDFSAIEARVLNWLADQQDMLAAFRAYDAGDKTKDPYVLMAKRMGPNVGRQEGKAAELGCGFQCGGRTFMEAAWSVYKIRVPLESAIAAVKMYRQTHDRVAALWKEAEAAFIQAVQEPGVVATFGVNGCVRVVVAGAYCYCVLPSGRSLCYARPKAVVRTITIEDDNGELKSFTKLGFEYEGLDSVTKQWKRQRAYGGFLVENVVQAIARDLLMEAELRVERNGYPIVLAVHDELVAEVPKDFGSLEQFTQLLATVPTWAQGCPVSAEGWRGDRYRKG